MAKYRIITREVSEYAYEIEADSLEEAKQNYSSGTETWGDAVSAEIINWEELED